MSADWSSIRCVECDDKGKAAEQPYCDHSSAYTSGDAMTDLSPAAGTASELAIMRERVRRVTEAVTDANAMHDRHAKALNGLIADCVGCLAQSILDALAGETR